MRGGPRGFRPGFPCPAVLRYLSRKAAQFRVRDCYPLWSGFPSGSAITQLCNFPTRRQADQDRPYNPRTTTTAVYHIARVWALPFSLATTQGVEVSFLSSGYLDVSVPQLASTCPMYSGTEYARITTREFPHSEIPGSKVGQHLPEAYRSRPRPSSALGAKASTVCSYSLDRKEHVLMSLWSFQGARELEHALREDRRPATAGRRSLKTQQRASYIVDEVDIDSRRAVSSDDVEQKSPSHQRAQRLPE